MSRVRADEAAELEAIVDETLAEEAGPKKFSIYGFMDFGLQRITTASPLFKAALPTEATSFVSGNNNIYLEIHPDTQWRALIETRLSMLPQGSYQFESLGTAKRIDNRIIDATSPSGRNNVEIGGLIIERAFLEWMYNDYLTIRAGRFFTPWGIWNVDHGTPTLIALMLPTFLVQDAIPQRQTGLELLGRYNAPPWQVAYSVTVANGRTPTLFDTTDGKALGARTVLRRQGALSFAGGLSLYHGDYQDEQKVLGIDSSANVTLSKQTIVAYDEDSVGLDLSIDYGGWRLRTETMARRVLYVDGKRESSPNLRGTTPDRMEYYFDAIAAYRWTSHLEPYLYYAYTDTGKRLNVIESGQTVSGGLNVYLNPSVQLKMQYARSSFENFLPERNVTNLWMSRLVMAF